MCRKELHKLCKLCDYYLSSSSSSLLLELLPLELELLLLELEESALPELPEPAVVFSELLSSDD